MRPLRALTNKIIQAKCLSDLGTLALLYISWNYWPKNKKTLENGCVIGTNTQYKLIGFGLPTIDSMNEW